MRITYFTALMLSLLLASVFFTPAYSQIELNQVSEWRIHRNQVADYAIVVPINWVLQEANNEDWISTTTIQNFDSTNLDGHEPWNDEMVRIHITAYRVQNIQNLDEWVQNQLKPMLGQENVKGTLVPRSIQVTSSGVSQTREIIFSHANSVLESERFVALHPSGNRIVLLSVTPSKAWENPTIKDIVASFSKSNTSIRIPANKPSGLTAPNPHADLTESPNATNVIL